MSTCTDTIRRLMAGHLDQPVTSGCTRADVVAVLGSDGSAGAGRLSNTERKWLDYEAKHTRAWFDDDDHLLMLVVTKPSVEGKLSALLTQLGKPEDQFESRSQIQTDDYDVRDHVYASKGLTLSVGKPLHGDAEPVLFAAYYYAPTTAQAYVGKLGGKDKWVRKFRPRR